VSLPVSEERLPWYDANWEMIEITTFFGPVTYARGRCKHRAPLPVYSVMDELVAYLCTNCDEQLETL
jgi:hypothetical protein